MAFTRPAIEQRMSRFFPGEPGRSLTTVVAALNDDILAISAAFTALAAKLNADAGVTDTNYVAPTITATGIG